MSKSIAIINTPDNCRECNFIRVREEWSTGYEYCCVNYKYIHTLKRPDWCPLIDIPAHIKNTVHINLGKPMDWEYIADHPEDNPFIGKEK